MALFTRILWAGGGTPASLNALREGCRLARAERSALLVVTVIPRYEGDLSLVGVRSVRGIMAEPCLQAFAAALEIAGEEGVPITRTLCEVGDIAEAIAGAAAAERCDLVVLGMRRPRPLWQRFSSGVLGGILARLRRDVLVIPEGTELGWGRVLVGTDGKACCAPAVARALDFARCYGGRLSVGVLSAPHPPTPSQAMDAEGHEPPGVDDPGEDVRLRAGAARVQVDCHRVSGPPDQALALLAAEVRAGLVVLASHQAIERSHRWRLPLVQALLQCVPCPLLVAAAP
jgi:nucleotide-binding universal stress UspA family protein